MSTKRSSIAISACKSGFKVSRGAGGSLQGLEVDLSLLPDHGLP